VIWTCTVRVVKLYIALPLFIGVGISACRLLIIHATILIVLLELVVQVRLGPLEYVLEQITTYLHY